MSDYADYVDQTVTSTIHLSWPPERIRESDIRSGRERVPTVRVLTIEGSDVTVEHNPAVSDHEVLNAKLRKLGFESRGDEVSPRKKGIFGRWIERLSAQNKKSLGSGSLDCCDLNKDN